MNEKNIKNIVDYISYWLKKQLEISNKKGYIIGISGGKDSTLAAALCCTAVGAEKVLGIFMPYYKSKDEEDFKKIVDYLKISNRIIDISKIIYSYQQILSINDTGYINRTRMTVLYQIAEDENYLVVNTSNLSEIFIGNFIKWGDSVGDVSFLNKFTVNELKQIGKYLQLPEEFYNKIPAEDILIDGQRFTDEERLLITYDRLDKFIRNEIKEKDLTQDEFIALRNGYKHSKDSEPFLNLCDIPEIYFN